MYRTLTAAVALAAALGMTGLAQAQTNSNSATTPMTTSPSASQPGMSGTQHPATMAPGQSQSGTYGQSGAANTHSSYGAENPQANAQSGQMQGSQQEIQQAQQQLKSQGLYHGAVDGIMGPETQTALAKFQRQEGLPQTAQLDQQTLSRLNGSSNSGMSGSSTMGNESGNGAHSMSPSTGAQNPASGVSGTQGSTTTPNR
ncbi:MAG TPA: peptidoglycan-binding domain-containing protein [Stellaceae bacterium]|nr:peptidoglycan-binding domain-containing protein [Stellaceae bacterium]